MDCYLWVYSEFTYQNLMIFHQSPYQDKSCENSGFCYGYPRQFHVEIQTLIRVFPPVFVMEENYILQCEAVPQNTDKPHHDLLASGCLRCLSGTAVALDMSESAF